MKPLGEPGIASELVQEFGNVYERGAARPEFGQDFEAQEAWGWGGWRCARRRWWGSSLGARLGLGVHQLDAIEPQRTRNPLTHRLQHLGPDDLKFLQLTDALARNAIPFSWEENRNLVVRERDSDRVEDLLDEIEYPEALDDEDTEALAGEVPYERVSDLFVAADRLMHAPEDVALAGELDLAARAVEGGRAPYGLAPDEWVRITELAAALRDDLAGDADADVIALDARTLRDLLRRVV